MFHRFASCSAVLFMLGACSTPPREGGLDPAPIVTGVQISPDSAALQPGDSIALTVTALLSDGSTSTVPVGWVATGGSIGAGAVYHAGSVPGQYLIIGSTAQFQFADTVLVSIQ
jgi:hypothetical protein